MVRAQLERFFKGTDRSEQIAPDGEQAAQVRSNVRVLRFETDCLAKMGQCVFIALLLEINKAHSSLGIGAVRILLKKSLQLGNPTVQIALGHKRFGEIQPGIEMSGIQAKGFLKFANRLVEAASGQETRA